MAGETGEAPRGRDVFVAGPPSAAVVAALFAAAFDLPRASALTEDASASALLEAVGASHLVVYALAPDGDFPFKVAMEFTRPIEVARFAAMARAHDVRVAYAVDEEAPHDVRYHVVDRRGASVRHLGFTDTEHAYTCTVLGDEGT